MSAVAVQADAPSHAAPAPQALVAVQAAHGAKPVALHVEPATQGGAASHVLLEAFHAKPSAHAQLDWPASVPVA